MKERPILFSTEMVRAIMDGRKTQTRRVVKPQPIHIEWFTHQNGWCAKVAENRYEMKECPYGVPSDRLWVRETWWMHDDPSAFDPNDGNVTDFDGGTRVVGYAASMDFDSVRVAKEYGARRRSSNHMPRWASRITLEVTDVRVERVQEISEADAIAEGLKEFFWDTESARLPHIRSEIESGVRYWEHVNMKLGRKSSVWDSAVKSFRELWDDINAKRGYPWASNPWVWAITFKVVKP